MKDEIIRQALKVYIESLVYAINTLKLRPEFAEQTEDFKIILQQTEELLFIEYQDYVIYDDF